MTTQLTKKVSRKSGVAQFSRGKLRRVIVTLYPNDVIGFRLEKTSKEELLPLGAAYVYAARLRVANEKRQREMAKKASKDSKLKIKMLNAELAKNYG